MNKLKLAARDSADLDVIAAQLQDAVAQIRDLVYLPKTRRFAALFNRFKWEDGKAQNLRIRTGLHFDTVLSVKTLNLRHEAPDAVVSLLTIRFTPTAPDDCAGIVELLFSGGGVLRLEVECLEAGLADMSDPWPTLSRPQHPLDEV